MLNGLRVLAVSGAMGRADILSPVAGKRLWVAGFVSITRLTVSKLGRFVLRFSKMREPGSVINNHETPLNLTFGC